MSYSTIEGSRENGFSVEMDRLKFLNLPREEIAEIVRRRGKPKNVALVVDGTRRMLQLTSYNDGVYSYKEDPANEMRELMKISVGAGDILFDMGVEVVTGPLATMGNLQRSGFVPYGLKLLLDPLKEGDTLGVLERHNAALTFYGDLDYIRSLDGGEIVDQYVNFFNNRNPADPKRRVLVGLAISSESDLLSAYKTYGQLFEQNRSAPTIEELRQAYFGFKVPPVDVFIRTNEVKESGCLHPLLKTDTTQLFFPVSPGILSMNERVLREIMYDYLYNRIRSGGTHEHQVLTVEEMNEARVFYESRKFQVIGVGSRVSDDFWIASSPDE